MTWTVLGVQGGYAPLLLPLNLHPGARFPINCVSGVFPR
jgi:hypothetical protein